MKRDPRRRNNVMVRLDDREMAQVEELRRAAGVPLAVLVRTLALIDARAMLAAEDRIAVARALREAATAT